MALFALTPDASDFLTLWGFVVGVVGLVVGVAGFWIAIVQIREARKAAEKGKEAAEAARDAANKTLAESKDAYERFIGSYASRLLSEVEGAIRRKDWQVVYLRCGDLAELLAILPLGRDAALNRLVEKCVVGLRSAARDFSALEGQNASELPKSLATRWKATLKLLQAKMDELRKPFRENRDGQSGNSNTAGGAEGDVARPTRPDEGASGQLGSGGRP